MNVHGAEVKALEARTALARSWRGRKGDSLTQEREGFVLHLDAAPALLPNKRGELVAIDAMVRLFKDGQEVPIDPHRISVNPPMQIVESRAEYDEKGKIVKERVLRYDPEAAYWEWLWQSVLEVPNAKGWRTKGTVTTFWADTSDGQIQSQAGTYSTARSGSGASLFAGGASISVGQEFDGANYSCFEGFISFDTSSLPDTDAVSQVDLALDGSVNNIASTNFTINARTFNWGASLTTGDWIAGASLSGNTLLATFATSGYSANYNTFTSQGAAFNAAINKTGTTYIVLSSSRHEGNNTPSDAEYIIFTSADGAGTTTDPKITITHAAAPTVELDSALKKVAASIGVSHRQTETLVASLKKVVFSGNLVMLPTVRLVSSLVKVAASIGVSHRQTAELDSVLRPVAASIQIYRRPELTLDSDLAKVTASVGVQQEQRLTLVSSLVKTSASVSLQQSQLLTLDSDIAKVAALLNLTVQPTMQVGGVLRPVSAALSLEQSQLLSLTSMLRHVEASIAVYRRPEVTIDSDIAKVEANINLIAPALLTLVSSLLPVSGALSFEQRQLVTLVASLVKVSASLSQQQSQLLTLDSDIAKVAASLSLSHRQLIELDAALRPVSAAFSFEHRQLVTLASTLAKVVMSGELDSFVSTLLLEHGTSAPDLRTSSGRSQQTLTLGSGRSQSAYTLGPGRRA